MGTTWEHRMLAVQHLTHLKHATITADNQKLNVYLAFTKEQKIRGLAHLEIIPRQGMLFIYQTDQTNPYTFTNTLTDLTVRWYNQAGHKLGQTHRHAQSTQPAYPPAPYRYVLETTQPDRPNASEGLSGVEIEQNSQNCFENFRLELPHDIIAYANRTSK